MATMRRLARSLPLLLALLVASPVAAQDFDFAAVPRVSLGLTNQGLVGAICSTGLLNFSKSTGAGTIKGSLLSGLDTRCQDGSTFPLSGGSLTFLNGNRSVTGTLGDEFLVGHALPGGHALIAADTFGPGSPAPNGLGLTALIERAGATFAQSNLTGRWRIFGLLGENGFFGGVADSYFGEIEFFANRSATGVLSRDTGPSQFIHSANLLVSANGSITGVVTTVEEGDIFTDVTINALMTPDKTFVAGVTASDRFEDFEQGMFFMQRDPAPTTFTAADLAGTWNLVSLQANPDDSSSGGWFTGGLTFTAIGTNQSTITASNLVDSNGATFPAVSDSAFVVSPDGEVFGQALFGGGPQGLVAFASISKDKKHIVGLDFFGQFIEGSVGLQTLGLFSMVKLAPPPPASLVQFSLGNYSVQEGLAASITVTRSGATTAAVTVDYLASDPLLESSLASGTITFAPGQTSATFPVPTAALADPFPGPDRLVTLSLSNPTNGATLGARATANLNVLNDDATFAFSQGTFTVSEKAGKAIITVNRFGALAFPVNVVASATPGTAVAGRDFMPVSRNLSFAKGITTATFEVPVISNSILDGNRSVALQLFPPALAARPGLPQPTEVASPLAATLIISDDDTPGVISLSSGTYSGDEGKSVVITIVRAPARAGEVLGGNVSVPYFTSDNSSAVADVDYAATAGSVTFTGTETMKTVSITLTPDKVAEGAEFFLFNLGTPTNGATLGRSIARVNINDVDRGGLVMLGASKFSVVEGAGNISITVKRTGATPSTAFVTFTTVAVEGGAIPGVDYGDVSRTLTFAANETQTVVIPIFQNERPDGDRIFTAKLDVPLGTALGSPASAPVTILDDESSIRFERPAFSAREGTPGVITAVRSGALITTAVVPYNISSLTAFPGVDFSGPVSGALTFRPGIRAQSFMIPTINNGKVDGNRSATITLGTPTGGAQLGSPSTASFTIVDDDQPGIVRMGSPTYTVREGGSVVVDIMRLPAPGNGGPLGNISVSYATASGNASAGEDFTHVEGTVVFGPTETKKSVTIQTLNNTLVEPTENFFFNLLSATNGATIGNPSSATILIQDDDSAGVVFLSQSAYRVTENAGNVSITVMRSGGTANASVHFQTIPGTALDNDRAPLGGPISPLEVASTDFGFVSTTLLFGANETKKTVVVPIFNDDLSEGDEVFFVRLSNPQGGLKLGSPANASVTIVDDEVVIQFSGKFKNNQPEVVRTGSLSANVSVQYFASSGTAILGDDFLLPPGVLVFPPGVSSRMIPINTLNDNIAEGPETFTITLLNPTPPAQLGPLFQQVFELDDNDFGGILNFSNTSPTATLGQTRAMTVTRTMGAGTVMTVDWAAIGGTAVPGVDFSPASGRFTFQANQMSQSFSVTISDSQAAAGKTIVFGLMPPGLTADFKSSKLGSANQSTLTIMGGGAVTPLTGLELISQSTGGLRGNADSARPATSADGRFVAFISAAGNLAPGAGQGAGVYVRDRQSGTTELVSVGTEGPEDGDATAVAISNDGRYVAFVSTSSNLVGDDGNGLADVFVRDRVGGSTQRVSMTAAGGDADGPSIDVAISGDGRFIAFTSFATNLAVGAGNTSNLYVFNRVAGTTQLVSGAAAPAPPVANFPPIPGGRSPALSVDGDFLAFVADDLSAAGRQAYVFDRSAGSIELVSQNDGTAANGSVVASPAISADGRFVAFESDATNLGPNASGHQIYVYDRTTGITELISQPPGGPAGNAPSTGPSLSADARFVAFVSDATNLVNNDTNGNSDVFVQDRTTGLVRRVNVLPNGTAGNGDTDTAVLSANGAFVAFATAATSLSSPDANESFDVLGVPVTIPALPTADIAITNVVNTAAPAIGASVTFTVTARNLGPAAATSVQVTDLLPAGYAFVSATPSQGSYASGTGLWTIGSLGSNNASATLTLTATVLAGGPYNTVATRTASSPSDPNSANDSAAATVTPQAIVLTTDGPLVGVGRTINGLITIPSPAPPAFAVTMNSSPGGVVSVPPIVAFVAGSTTAPFTVTGLAVGNASITAGAAGLTAGSVNVAVTNSVISLGALANLGPGQSLSLPISLSVAAPAGGVTVNFTSANTSIATVTGSVFIPGNSQVPAANPQVTGVAVGSTGITASATGFAPDTRTANVVVSASFSPSPFSVVVGTSKNITVTLSAPAPSGGFTFNLATANSSVATVASPVTVAAGQTSVQVPVNGVVIASTTLQASGAGVTSGTVTVNVTVPPPVSVINQTVGRNLQVQTSLSLGAAAPAGGVSVTLTSSNGASMILSPSGTAGGNASIVMTVPAGGTSASFFVQALAGSGAATLSASAPGYQNGSSTVTLVPSGFIINSPGDFTTTTLSGNQSIQITAARLNPATLAFAQNQAVRGGLSPVSVTVTATDQTGGPGVGAITSTPVIFTGGDSSSFTSFDPDVAGTSLIQVVTPSGFNTSTNFRALTATVTAPTLTPNAQTVGQDLQQATNVGLGAPAPAGLIVTLTSGDPSKLLLSGTSTATGNGSITLTLNAGATSAQYWAQALANSGSVTVTARAPAYQNGSALVTLVPSGFIINSPGNFNTTTLSVNQSIQITSARLNPATLAFAQNQELRAGVTPVSVDVTATDQTGGPGVGAITTSPLVFSGGDSSKFTTFDPVVAGGSLIEVVTPSGFNTSTNFRAITATVSAPTLSLNNLTVGKDLQQSSTVSLSAPAPSGGLLVTLTSADASKLVLSPTETGAGNGSIVLSINQGSSSATYWAQALAGSGLVGVTATAPAYQNDSATTTLVPSAFIINSPGDFGTTTFSGNTNIQITSARLNPATLAFAANQELRAGITPVSVDVTATDVTGGPGVGAVTASPLLFSAGDVSKFTNFNPAASGTSLIQVLTPSGFNTSTNFRSVTATVSAPNINVSTGNVLVGRDLQTSVFVSLQAAPPTPVTVTITVASTAVATLSRNQSAEGTSSVTFTNVSGTSVGSFFVQGRTFPGTTTITVQAPGFNDAQSTVTTQPSGFIINSPGNFTTNTAAGNTNIQVVSARLDPTTLNFAQSQEVRGGLSVQVPVTSSNTAVGTITTSPVTIGGGTGSVNTQFNPATAGTSDITVGVPTGFNTPSNFRQITATVNP